VAKLTHSQRERLRLVIEETILVRRGEVITPDVAEERSRNMVTIVEAFIDLNEFEDEEEDQCTGNVNESNEGQSNPGSGSSGPASTAGGSTSTKTRMGSGSPAGTAAKNTAETMETHARRVIR